MSILPDPDSLLVATQLWYHVGSANEDPGQRGFAHLFEHLMFGPTANHDRDDYASLHHCYGGYENAYTAFDETVYLSEIIPEQHQQVLQMEADRMVNLLLEKETLANEKRIVSEELRVRVENDPFNRVLVATLEAVVGDHPYGHAPAGSHDDIAAATLEQCRLFYRQYYQPDNAHLVVVGPVDPEVTEEVIRRSFGAIAAGGEVPAKVPPLTEHDLVQEVVLTEDLPPVEIALLAFPTPPADAADFWPRQVLIQLLSGGSVDPFAEALVRRRRKAVYARTEWLEGRRGGALVFAAAHLPYRRRMTAFRLMEETVRELSRLEWLNDESLASSRRALIRRELNRVYFPRQRATVIGRSLWWLGDERFALSAPACIEAVSREQVADVYRQLVAESDPVHAYLKPEKVPILLRLLGWLYPVLSR